MMRVLRVKKSIDALEREAIELERCIEILIQKHSIVISNAKTVQEVYGTDNYSRSVFAKLRAER